MTEDQHKFLAGTAAYKAHCDKNAELMALRNVEAILIPFDRLDPERRFYWESIGMAAVTAVRLHEGW